MALACFAGSIFALAVYHEKNDCTPYSWAVTGFLRVSSCFSVDFVYTGCVMKTISLTCVDISVVRANF